MSEDWDLEVETGVSQLNITENANFLRQEEPVAFGKSYSNGGAADYGQSFRSNRGYGRGRRGGMRNDQRSYERLLYKFLYFPMLGAHACLQTRTF